MKTAVIYARYSSDTQTEQSIEGQLRVCQEYAARNQIIIVDTYIDRAMTGTNDNRRDFQRMLHDSGKQAWDYVLVYKLDRFSRNKYEMAMHKKTLRDNGVKILSAMENIPDTPEGIILESLLEGMAEYYSAELSQKVLRGLNESYIKGNFTGGYYLYGYDIVDKKCKVNPEEAAIVYEVFVGYADGYTVPAMVANLKFRGIRDKRGKFFTTSALYKMLGNSKYNGKVIIRGVVYDNIYPQIIPDDLWRIVQKKREENKHAPGRKKDIYDFLLSGKLVCGDCHRMMVGESGTSMTGDIHYYYTCLSRRRKRATCHLKSVRKQYLEDIVLNTVWNILSEKGVVRMIATTLYKLHEKECKDSSTLKSLETRRNAALKASKNLISAIEQGIITEQTKIRLKELENEISELDVAIEQEKIHSYTYLTVEMIEKFLYNATFGDIQEVSVRKSIVNTFVREVIYYPDKSLSRSISPIPTINPKLRQNSCKTSKSSLNPRLLFKPLSVRILSLPSRQFQASIRKYARLLHLLVVFPCGFSLREFEIIEINVIVGKAEALHFCFRLFVRLRTVPKRLNLRLNSFRRAIRLLRRRQSSRP